MNKQRPELSLLTVGEAAKLLNVHTNTLRQWTDRGILNAHRIGPRGDRRLNLADIIRISVELRTNNGHIRKAHSD